MTAQTVSLVLCHFCSFIETVCVCFNERAHLCQFCRKTRSYKTICDGITPAAMPQMCTVVLGITSAVMPQMCTVVLLGLGLFRVTTHQKMRNSLTIR